MNRCTSWRGHKFEPRYSKSATSGVNLQGVTGCSEAFVENLFDMARTITYVCDVCVRCGAVVKPEVQS